MKQINLLPWRDHARAWRRKEFLLVCLGGLFVVLGIVVLVHCILVERISYQEYRNKLLSHSIAQIDAQLVEMKKIIDNKQIILDRIAIIHTLLTNRSEIIILMTELARIVPQGVLLTSIKREGSEIRLEGKAESNTVIAKMMREIEASQWLQQSVLNEINADTKNNESENNNFIITLRLKIS